MNWNRKVGKEFVPWCQEMVETGNHFIILWKIGHPWQLRPSNRFTQTYLLVYWHRWWRQGGFIDFTTGCLIESRYILCFLSHVDNWFLFWIMSMQCKCDMDVVMPTASWQVFSSSSIAVRDQISLTSLWYDDVYARRGKAGGKHPGVMTHNPFRSVLTSSCRKRSDHYLNSDARFFRTFRTQSVRTNSRLATR